MIEKIDIWKFNNVILDKPIRFSINAISWIGSNHNFGDFFSFDEEKYLTTEFPRLTNTQNIIYGGPLCVHFAFYTQRDDELESMLDIISDI